MNPITSFLVFVFVLAGLAIGNWVNPFLALAFFAVAAIIALSLKMANAWQKFVTLRMGKLQSVKGPGMFAIIQIIDNVVAVIDGRIQTTAFNAEQALTRDTAPVNVDAIIFWHVHDAEKAALARVEMKRMRQLVGAACDYANCAGVSASRPATDYTPRLISRHDGVTVPLEAAQILWQR